MYTMVSEVLNPKTAFGRWHGRNTRMFQTSNRLIAKWVSFRQDSRINSVTVKQLADYDVEMLEKVLTDGVVILYQTHEITLTRVNQKSIAVEVVNLKTGDYQEETLSQKTMKTLVVDNGTVNHDVLDVLQAIYEKVKW
jgi:hypothetical protein